jgi:hypothetical protein
MPSRMIRDTLLGSDRFLGLPDNTARMCFVACMLTADDRGNLEASPGALVRLWRDFGVDSNAKAVSTSQFLADQDLIRLYQVDGKQYIHVPRFGQRMRSFKRACPASPWCENVDSSSTSLPICQQVAANGSKSPPEVKRREVKGSTASGSRRSAKTPIPDDFAITDRMRSWAAEKQIFNLERHFAYFVNQAKAKDYRNVDWSRAFMNAVLSDWAKIGKGKPSDERPQFVAP